MDWFVWEIDGPKPYKVKLDTDGDAEMKLYKLTLDGDLCLQTTEGNVADKIASRAATYFVEVSSSRGQPQKYELTVDIDQ